MKTLRALTWLRLALLASFLCVLGAATASPLAHPARTQLVCVGGGVVLMALGDDGLPVSTASLDCPLCLPAVGPASASVTPPPSLDLAAAQPQAEHPSSVIALSAAPPPGRGPPVFY
ncbi:MAG: hypothetical protein ACTS5V_05925 [Giesbergeria sp.]